MQEMRELSQVGEAAYKQYLDLCELVDLHAGFSSVMDELTEDIERYSMYCTPSECDEMRDECTKAAEEAVTYRDDACHAYEKMCDAAGVEPDTESMIDPDGRLYGGVITRSAFAVMGSALNMDDRMAVLERETTRPMRRYSLPADVVHEWQREYNDAHTQQQATAEVPSQKPTLSREVQPLTDFDEYDEKGAYDDSFEL